MEKKDKNKFCVWGPNLIESESDSQNSLGPVPVRWVQYGSSRPEIAFAGFAEKAKLFSATNQYANFARPHDDIYIYIYMYVYITRYWPSQLAPPFLPEYKEAAGKKQTKSGKECLFCRRLANTSAKGCSPTKDMQTPPPSHKWPS